MNKGVIDVQVYLKRGCLHIELKRCGCGTIRPALEVFKPPKKNFKLSI